MIPKDLLFREHSDSRFRTIPSGLVVMLRGSRNNVHGKTVFTTDFPDAMAWSISEGDEKSLIDSNKN
jgi:hypothetical protein